MLPWRANTTTRKREHVTVWTRFSASTGPGFDPSHRTVHGQLLIVDDLDAMLEPL
jgi:hypothetical protein